VKVVDLLALQLIETFSCYFSEMKSNQKSPSVPDSGMVRGSTVILRCERSCKQREPRRISRAPHHDESKHLKQVKLTGLWQQLHL